MKQRTAEEIIRELLARKPIKRVSKKRGKSRIGKLGITRLAGKDMTALREAAYDRAAGMCEMRLPGCERYAGWLSGHLAHIKTKRNNGDVDNTLWACAHCHLISHQYGPSGEKPCPKREGK